MAVWQGVSRYSICSGQLSAEQHVRKDTVQSCHSVNQHETDRTSFGAIRVDCCCAGEVQPLHDADLWAEIVGALPDEYQGVVAYAEMFAQENKSEDSLAAVEIELDAHYQRLYGTMKYKRGTESQTESQTGLGELTFSAVSPGMGHKKSVTCYACGKEGHIKKDCPQYGSEGTTKTLCPLCKKKHKGGEGAYFLNPKNSRKAKKWRKKGNRSVAEVGGLAVAPEFGFQATTAHVSGLTLADPHLSCKKRSVGGYGKLPCWSRGHCALQSTIPNPSKVVHVIPSERANEAPQEVTPETQAKQEHRNAPKRDIGTVHAVLGHMSEAATRWTSRMLQWPLKKGPLGPCEPCIIGKGRRTNVNKSI
jgi:hypothetical protein